MKINVFPWLSQSVDSSRQRSAHFKCERFEWSCKSFVSNASKFPWRRRSRQDLRTLMRCSTVMNPSNPASVYCLSWHFPTLKGGWNEKEEHLLIFNDFKTFKRALRLSQSQHFKDVCSLLMTSSVNKTLRPCWVCFFSPATANDASCQTFGNEDETSVLPWLIFLRFWDQSGVSPAPDAAAARRNVTVCQRLSFRQRGKGGRKAFLSADVKRN